MRFRNLGLNVIALVGLNLACPAIAHVVGDGQAKTAAQIFADAKQVTTRAKDFHVFGGFNFGSAETWNLNVSPDGGGGTFQLLHVTFNVVFAAGTLYVKANEKGWETLGASKRTAELMGNNWIKEARTSPQYSFAQFVESALLVGTITSGMNGFAELPGTTSAEGQKALMLTDSEHDKIYIASVGTPYILRVQGGGGGSSGSLSFSGFGHTSLPKAPTHWIRFPK